MTSSLLTAGGLVLLAAMHSLLGERRILVPLLAARWSIGMHRSAAERIIRFAWHLTSLTLVGLAAVVMEAEPGIVIGAVCLSTAIVIVLSVRTHPAWPVFLLSGLAALDAGGVLPSSTRTVGGLFAAAGLAAAAGLHLYWVGGGRWLTDRVIPTEPARIGGNVDPPPQPRSPGSRRMPGRMATAAVAVGLMVLAAAVGVSAVGVDQRLVRVVGWVGVAVFILRIVGDGRFVGFTKSIRSTPFACADDRFFTPFMVLLVVGSTGGLLSVV